MIEAQTLELASAVARYHANCLRVVGAQNVAQTDVRTAKRGAYPCDLGQLVELEQLLRYRQVTITAPPHEDPDSDRYWHYLQRLAVWERLRELAAKLAVESHQKEAIYATPLLSGFLRKRGSPGCQPVLAPLFLQNVTVDIQTDGSVLIKASDDPPRFNTSVWDNAFDKSSAEQIITLGVNAQADLVESWDDARIGELLQGIRAVFPGLSNDHVDDTILPWPERASPAEAAQKQPCLRLHPGAALYLANKSSPYLLADLVRIAERPGDFVVEDRPLSILLRPPARTARPELEHLDIHEVLFPFPSNGRQRRVVDAVDKNRIVVVQGPPGTGKSLTIANLVAHLVGKGKRVLVCSHKEQALTVVRDKLDEMGLRFLYASVVGTRATTKRELQGQIQEVRSFFGKVNQHELRRQLQEVDERRRRNGERYQELRDDFNDRAEAEQAEAEELLLSIEGVELLPTEDPVVPERHRTAVAEGLRRLDELARRHGEVWPRLCASPISRETEVEVEREALSEFLELQEARLAAADDSNVQELVRRWQPIAEQQPAQIDAAREVVDVIARSLRGPLAALDDHSDPDRARAMARAIAADTHLLADARSALEKVSNALAQAREREDARSHIPTDAVVRRREVLVRHGELSRLLKRRAARKWLEQHAPGGAGLSTEQVQEWADFWDSWQTIRDTCDVLDQHLRLDVPESYEPAIVRSHLTTIKRALDVAEGIEQARKAERKQTEVRLPLDDVLSELSAETLATDVERWCRALMAVAADASGNTLKIDHRLAWLRDELERLDAAVDEERHDDARRLLADLRTVLAALPAIAERARLLAGPTGKQAGAIGAIEDAAASGDPPPAFLSDLEAAFAAQPEAHRLEEIRSGRSTRALAKELGELRDTILADARQYLSLRIQQRIYEGFRRPTFTASLERFRKAISTSARRFDRIEELKNAPDFDVDVLTEVFPCWIMRPEDACRMFPLRHDIFDVVIFDEASQCNPDQTLPIFARAKRAVVFGDERQLANEDLKRSLSAETNRSLLQQSGLAELDPSRLFDQTQNSLLGMVSHRAQESTTLSEHFRCRPELAAFSNNHYYADGLRIMRDEEDDRGLGPAILVHELKDVPLLGKSKVNPYEAKALVDELCRLLDDPVYDGLTFGVLSLFREQIEYIATRVEERIPRDVRERRRLICSTVDGFQGDERDVILYSWRYSRGQSPAIFAFTNGDPGDRRMNVALTRARHQAIHFISAPLDEFRGSSNVGKFMQHVQSPEQLLRAAEDRVYRDPDTEARRRAASCLRDAGFAVHERFVTCGVSIDLVVQDPETWARAAVFVDCRNDPARPPTADRRVDAHGLLERAGWTVERILAEEALCRPEEVVARVRAALERCGPRDRPKLDTERIFTHFAQPEVGDEPARTAGDTVAVDAAPEDYASYHWLAPSVEARLAAGEDVFHSDFERELYDRLAVNEDLRVVPQWPSRGKFIDLVVTDRAGRRLAVEADGEQHHETVDGQLIPEDVDRQQLLEEVGWVFHRVRHTDFVRDADGQIEQLLERLAAQPANPDLAAAVWGDQSVSLDELKELVEPAAVAGPADEPQDPPEQTDVASGKSDASVRHEGSVRSSQASLRDGAATPSVEDYRAGARDTEPVERASRRSNGGADTPTRTSTAPSTNSHEPEPRVFDPFAYRGAHLHDVPLALLPQQITIVVREHGAVGHDELPDAFVEHFEITVPRNRRRLLTSFAWSAHGRQFISRDGDAWVPGRVTPEPIDGLATWTMRRIEDLVRRLQADGVHRDDLFEHALAQVWSSPWRAPRPVTRTVGACVYAVVGQR